MINKNVKKFLPHADREIYLWFTAFDGGLVALVITTEQALKFLDKFPDHVIIPIKVHNETIDLNLID